MITLTKSVSPTKQTVPFVLAENQQILLMPVGDVHFGTKGWPERKFRAHLQWGLDRGAHFIGMGEYLDFTSYSQREIMAPLRDSVRKQMDDMIKLRTEELAEIMKPTKGRWVGLLEGDHRWDFENATSIDQYLADKLETSFLGTSALVRLHPSKAPKDHPEADTIVLVHHGTGSSRTSGGHLNMLDKQVEGIHADVYLMGHSHSKATSANDRIEMTPDGVLTHRTVLEARTGAWLRGYYGSEPLDNSQSASESRGSYAEQAAYRPSALGGLCIGIGFKKIGGSAYYRPTIHYSV